MMQAIRYVSRYGMDLTTSLHDSILRNWRKLLDHDIAPIRTDLEDILVGANAGKALNMMFDTGLMAVIFGEEVARKISAQEGKQFIELCEGIDKVKPFRLRRLGLLYTVLNEKRGLKAIERMQFDEKTEMHLRDAMTEMIKIQFIRSSPELKQYVFSVGMDRYNYVHNLSKAQRIVYDQPELRIEGRNHMMREIRRNGEPLFVEDLVIDANDIMEAGITDDPARAEELLGYVIAKVHQDPRNNDRKYLLKMAKKYHKSKFKVRTRYVNWMR
jgi:tRNA nucleotidyltransferase/poly(A) polymerase